MLDLRGRVLDLDVRHGVRAAFGAEQQRIALGEVAHAVGVGGDADQPAIGVVTLARADAFGDDGRAAALAVVDHLGPGVGLLVVVGHRDRVELADRILAVEHAARVLPGHRRAGLDLGPRNLTARALTQPALGHEIVDAALALGVARVPVLHGRVLDLGILERDELDHCGVELVLVAHRRGAAFEVGNVRALVGDDQRALELAGVLGIDAEIGAELHRAAHALGDVDEGAVGEDRAVERGEEVVALRHHLAEPLLHQLRVLADRLADREEDHPGLLELLAEGGRHADAVEHRIDRDLARALDAGEHLLLFERDAELLVNLEDFGIDFVEALERRLLLRRGVVVRVLIVDRRIAELGPVRLCHLLPQPERLQPPLEHPLGLALLGADEAHGRLVEALGGELGVDLGRPAVLILGRPGSGFARGAVLDF